MVAERKKSVQKKNAIMDAAMQIFLEKGYTGTSTNEICQKANINKPSLYNFFKNKRNLFFACHNRSMNNQLLPYLKNASLIRDHEDRLKFMIREFTRIMCTSPELKVLIHETMSMTDDYFWKIRNVWKQHFILLKETITNLRNMGIVETTLTPSRAALYILGMITWITFWYDYGRNIEEIEVMAESSLEFVLKGLSYKGG